MNSLAAFTRFSKLVVITVFLVILAGGVVRMTQSGMGCPDWPKCFGRWIPPTHENQLPSNYKEIYAFKYVDLSFNVYHTWIEYINRLLGAILGLLLFIQFIWSLRFNKSGPMLKWVCLALLLITGFQGWLGSKVVEANLEVIKVTTHMMVALVIAALSVTIIFITNSRAYILSNRTLKIITFMKILKARLI
jgi:cytochrome c oxidase assembly protein subunit 15